jgi:hypothetical protein
MSSDPVTGEYDPDEEYAWICTCGNYEESAFHCSLCGAEPPWGCDCGACSDPCDWEEGDYEEWDDDLADEYDGTGPCSP